jgi:hypothetical protein
MAAALSLSLGACDQSVAAFFILLSPAPLFRREWSNGELQWNPI